MILSLAWTSALALVTGRPQALRRRLLSAQAAEAPRALIAEYPGPGSGYLPTVPLSALE